ncbi:keywimysin-related RiPP [Brevibacterium sp. HMSC07C04]|nr:keywimysin-related RiPP [Brevibacterium sp. HMSC07C04]
MKKAYESPALVELGDFHASTGEFPWAPEIETVLPIRDFSA